MEQTQLQDGKYEILHEIGQGGMAVVYKGRDTSLDREVAVKVLHPHLAGRADSRMRLQREARAVAKLHHPNILEIYDYSGLESESSYIITEYIRGETLKDFTDRHTPSLPEVGAMVVHEVADALAHAHDAGIIHRDIKPENIMIRDDGVLKLMDFGIAQIVDMQAMTVTGALVGSPAHMSPEHVEGKTLDFRADVFSLGTMLYFLCAGRLPFDSPSPHALLRQILEAQYDDPRLHNPAIGRRLRGIITRCLAKDPDDRYDSVDRLRDDLKSYLDELELKEPAEELAVYFEEPATAEAALTRRVVDQLMHLAESSARSGKVAAALESYNQVLALEGDRKDALAMVQRLSSSRSRSQRLKWVAAAVVAVLAIVGIGWSVQEEAKAPAELPKLSDHSVATPVAVAPAQPLPTAEPAPPKDVEAIKAPEAAPAPVPRIVRAGFGPKRRPAAALELYATAPPTVAVTSVPNKIVFARKPKKPKKPAVKPAAPTAAKPTSGVKIKILGQFGSAVKFRGKLYSSGDTKTLVVQPGAYSAEIIPSCTGCLPRTHRFNVTPEGKSLFKFPPAFQDATLVVRAVPSNATIIFRGKPMRSGTPVNIKMRRPRETFVVKVSAPGYQPTNRGVKVTTATRTEVTVTLQR